MNTLFPSQLKAFGRLSWKKFVLAPSHCDVDGVNKLLLSLGMGGGGGGGVEGRGWGMGMGRGGGRGGGSGGAVREKI